MYYCKIYKQSENVMQNGDNGNKSDHYSTIVSAAINKINNFKARKHNRAVDN